MDEDGASDEVRAVGGGSQWPTFVVAKPGLNRHGVGWDRGRRGDVALVFKAWLNRRKVSWGRGQIAVVPGSTTPCNPSILIRGQLGKTSFIFGCLFSILLSSGS